MTDSYRVLCSDFYINQKLNVKLDLPRSRDTALDLFERLRRQYPEMSSFRRHKDELALESPARDVPHRWAAVRSNSIRSGVVNPEDEEQAYGLHRSILEVAPYFLSISPLDIEYLELLYGFDLAASGSHDRIVADALLAGSPLAALADLPGGQLVEFQPLLGALLNDTGDIEAHFEVKTRSGPRDSAATEPISVYLTLRRYEPVRDVAELTERFEELAEKGQQIVAERVVPGLLQPIKDSIVTGNL
ncbi:MAG: hypothetical protein ACI89L_000454 [Phycisphaerales bacterium]|jgi:hypothetical protein